MNPCGQFLLGGCCYAMCRIRFSCEVENPVLCRHLYIANSPEDSCEPSHGLGLAPLWILVAMRENYGDIASLYRSDCFLHDDDILFVGDLRARCLLED